MKKVFFSTSPYFADLAKLLLRVGSALMMLTHGWSKISNFSTNLTSFRDPIGLGPAISLQLAIFAEFFCAILLAIGFLSRLSLIPLIITMSVAAFIAHADDPFSSKEKPLLFLLIFIVLLFLGPGRYSVDGQIKKNRNY
ncbi:DoxX family protein [Indibacter alkaliphilus LW1]|jgi:putative oxidoreductase|uniref:DoxX family protein n=1 Tax=Indibacter alkaliphilus (strain CCUG 57479 / KCTC 22604 / LW1) TaxID=1189612 RepID=S2D548_INDAL|nr:DoxX family protein [Indibacter alkaliphilus]EOZ92180.1 DoxX family protein [Indibacter alkaliphilus LW1]